MNKNKKKSNALSEGIFNNVTGGNIHKETLPDKSVRWSVYSDDRSDLLHKPGMDVNPMSLLPEFLAAFDTEQKAIDYARDHGIDTTIKDYRVSTSESGLSDIHPNNSNTTLW